MKTIIPYALLAIVLAGGGYLASQLRISGQCHVQVAFNQPDEEADLRIAQALPPLPSKAMAAVYGAMPGKAGKP